jgi:hypothetical protein
MNYIIIAIIIIFVGILQRIYRDKLAREENMNDFEYIRKYLLEDNKYSLGSSKIKKPIMWIHIPYEYNSRSWLSFGSRNTKELNQPYLYLTVKSIINHCGDSFNICLIDDNSFSQLMPDWNIDFSKLTDPILSNMRQLAMLKLVYLFGGMTVPMSFICFNNLIDIYEKETENNKMFVFENKNDSVTAINKPYLPDIKFMGAKKENESIRNLIEYIEIIISKDSTAQLDFIQQFNRQVQDKVRNNEINMVDSAFIGIKDAEYNRITIEHLFSDNLIQLNPNTYGIYIPANEILKRKHYYWFVYLSPKEVLKVDANISKYLLLGICPNDNCAISQNIQQIVLQQPNWIEYWKVPLNYPLWGLKPMYLGNNILTINEQ